jgi:antibiotic biosynthesis monooxygenase (ABM) superfamily enzyme
VGIGYASTPLLGELPFAIAAAPQTMLSVALMAWLVMPRVTRIASRWLYPAG